MPVVCVLVRWKMEGPGALAIRFEVLSQKNRTDITSVGHGTNVRS